MNNLKQTTKGNRIYFLDNLRTVIIILVILYHAGGVYESSGSWASFWIVDDAATNDIAGLLNIVLDIMMMPIMFFISGYLLPLSLKKKNSIELIKAKFKRLMLPWLLAVLTLIPLYKVIFLASRNLPQETWTSYFHFSSGNISGQGWLWFLPLLFAFNLMYLALARFNLLPKKMSVKTAVFALFFIGFINSLSLDLLQARGWTHTALLDFQNERVLIYFMMFLFGSLCFHKQVFAQPRNKKLFTAVNSTLWLPITLYIIFLLYPIITQKEAMISLVIDRSIVWLSFHATLLCMLYLLLELFRGSFDKPGKIWRELNQNSYNVYIIHVIVLGVIGLLMLNLAIPSLLKYAILTLSTILVSNIIISLYRRAKMQRTQLTKSQRRFTDPSVN